MTMYDDYVEEEILSEEEVDELYEKAMQCVEEGDLEKAAELLTRADISGCKKTEILFHFDFNGRMKKVKLKPWQIEVLKISAENGYAPAQFSLGARYRAGLSVKKDREEAFYWFSKAAERNDTKAIAHMGDMYDKGRGVEQDRVKAFECYKRAADLGYAPSQFTVGLYYEKGEVVDYDPKEAMRYFIMSDDGGYVIATNHLGMKYEEGKLIPADYLKAYDYYKKTLEIGYNVGNHGMFRLYYFGLFVEKDIEKAAYYARRVPDFIGLFQRMAAEVGFDEAKSFFDDYELYKPAEYYLVGKKMEEEYDGSGDISEMVDYYLKSGEAGYLPGYWHLGVIYEKGIVVEADLDKAIGYYRKASEKGYGPARAKLKELNR